MLLQAMFDIKLISFKESNRKYESAKFMLTHFR